MNYYALQVSTPGRREPWWGEAETIHDAIVLAEAAMPGRVVYGTAVTADQYERRATFA